MNAPELRLMRALALHARDCMGIARGHLRKSKGRRRSAPREHTRAFLSDAERSLAELVAMLEQASGAALDDADGEWRERAAP